MGRRILFVSSVYGVHVHHSVLPIPCCRPSFLGCEPLWDCVGWAGLGWALLRVHFTCVRCACRATTHSLSCRAAVARTQMCLFGVLLLSMRSMVPSEDEDDEDLADDEGASLIQDESSDILGAMRGGLAASDAMRDGGGAMMVGAGGSSTGGSAVLASSDVELTVTGGAGGRATAAAAAATTSVSVSGGESALARPRAGTAQSGESGFSGASPVKPARRAAGARDVAGVAGSALDGGDITPVSPATVQTAPAAFLGHPHRQAGAQGYGHGHGHGHGHAGSVTGSVGSVDDGTEDLDRLFKGYVLVWGDGQGCCWRHIVPSYVVLHAVGCR